MKLSKKITNMYLKTFGTKEENTYTIYDSFSVLLQYIFRVP